MERIRSGRGRRAASAEWKKNARTGMGTGLLAQAGAGVLHCLGLAGAGPWSVLMAKPLGYAGVLLLVWGCACYAKGKGRRGAWGLLGLLSLAGVALLVALPGGRPARANG